MGQMTRGALVGALLLVAGVMWANEPINADDGIAIHGYDPVAYFTEGQPTAGSERYSYDWSGATWYFASAENLELFEGDPERYAPAYGGYCAWAVGRGTVADIDPDQWIIEDGRLFLNFSGWTQFRFENNLGRNISSADENWPSVRQSVQ